MAVFNYRGFALDVSVSPLIEEAQLLFEAVDLDARGLEGEHLRLARRTGRMLPILRCRPLHHRAECDSAEAPAVLGAATWPLG